jgi:site-specific DNA recombinase
MKSAITATTQNLAALYARVSSERQAEEKTIQSQLAALREYAAKQNYIVKEEHIFSDNGVSGSELIRPALEELRDVVASGVVHRVVVLCPDRLSRKQAHQLILSDEFSRHDVELEFVNYTASSSPEDQLFLQMQGAIAEYEREKIMERSRRGKIYKAKGQKVCVLSGAPYGFVYHKRSDSGEATYEIHPEESKVVKQIFQMLGLERLSIGAIVRHLNETKVNRPGSSMWYRSTVHRILTNPAYTGKAAYKKTQVAYRKNAPSNRIVRGLKARYPKSSKVRINLPQEAWISINVPRIIPDSLFERVNEQLQDNKRFSKRNNKRNDYLLSGLLQCRECGYALYGITTSGRSKTERSYYRCSGGDAYRHPNGARCSSHFIRTQIIDDLTWEQTKQLIEQPELILAEYANRTNEKGKQQLSIQSLIATKQKEIRRIENEKSRLLDLYQAGTVTIEEIKVRLADIQKRTDDTQSEHDELLLSAQQEHQQLQLIDNFEVFQRNLKSNLSEISFADRKKIVQLLVKQVEVDCSKAEITVKHVVPMTQNVYGLCPDRVIGGLVDSLSRSKSL